LTIDQLTVLSDLLLGEGDRLLFQPPVNGTEGEEVLLRIEGCVQLGGELEVELERPEDVVLFEFNPSCINGSFERILFSFSEEICEDFEAEAVEDENEGRFSLSFSLVGTDRCSSSTSSSVDLAIILGASLGGVFFLVLVIIAAVVLLKPVRKFVFPFMYYDREQQEAKAIWWRNSNRTNTATARDDNL